MRTARRSIVAPALCAASLLAAPASAGEPGVELRWVAPGACPDAAQVRAALERLIGRPLGGEPPISVRIVVAPALHRPWAARISITRPGDAAPGERWIEGATCSELADAAVVAVALAIEPPPPVEPPPPAPPQPSITLRPGLRVSAGVDFAALPRPSPGVEIAAVLLAGANRMEVHGSAWLPETAVAATSPAVGGKLHLLAAGARYCRTLVPRTFELAGCGGVEAGVVRGSGFGVSRPRSEVAPWVALGLRAFGAWRLSPTFSTTLALDAIVPVSRAHFTLDDVGEIHHTPPITGRALIGLEVLFR